MRLLNSFYFGINGAKKNYRGQIRHLIEDGIRRLGVLPSVIGESGIPFDMNDRYAYMTGDYTRQVYALDSILSAFEMNLLSYTLWNYNPLNNHRDGDHWNKEDFSIYCSEDRLVLPTVGLWVKPPKKGKHTPRSKSLGTPLILQEHEHQYLAESIAKDTDSLDTSSISTESLSSVSPPNVQLNHEQLRKLFDVYAGGRALEALIRPHAFKITGIPLAMAFDITSRVFTLEYESSTQPWLEGVYTEIFAPWLHYPYGVNLKLSDGDYRYDAAGQTVFYRHDPLIRRHILIMSPKTIENNWYQSNACSIQ